MIKRRNIGRLIDSNEITSSRFFFISFFHDNHISSMNSLFSSIYVHLRSIFITSISYSLKKGKKVNNDCSQVLCLHVIKSRYFMDVEVIAKHLLLRMNNSACFIHIDKNKLQDSSLYKVVVVLLLLPISRHIIYSSRDSI